MGTVTTRQSSVAATGSGGVVGGAMTFARRVARRPQAEPRLARFGFTCLALAGPALIAAALDDRVVLGVNTWIKPTKFFLSTALYALTLAGSSAFLRTDQRSTRSARWVVWATVGGGAFELAIITARAALAQQSHFNTRTTVDAALYNAMAVGALVLVSTAAVQARLIWRSGVLDGARRLGWTAGLALAGTFGAVTGMVMGGGTGHMVAADGTRVATSAATVPFLGWATDIGDLRIAHFAALHAMFVLPLVGSVAARHLAPRAAGRVTAVGACGWTAAILAVLANAIAGQPL